MVPREPRNARAQPDTAEPLANNQFATDTTATTEAAWLKTEPRCACATWTGQELGATKRIIVKETRAKVTVRASARVPEATFVIAMLDSSAFCAKSVPQRLRWTPRLFLLKLRLKPRQKHLRLVLLLKSV